MYPQDRAKLEAFGYLSFPFHWISDSGRQVSVVAITRRPLLLWRPRVIAMPTAHRPNFYASPEYLDTVANVYFRGKRAAAEDICIAGQVLRLLVVGGKRVITRVPFLDYHSPIASQAPCRQHGYAEIVAHKIITYDEWFAGQFAGFVPAPFVDWKLFSTFDEFMNYVKPRGKDLLREAARRRRKLETDYGTLVFTVDDARDDVLRNSIQWKSAQLRETGLTDIFQDPRNIEFFHELRRRSLLRASTLRANDRLLSAWLGFVHDGVWSGWIFTYDHDPLLKKYSVGRQLLHSMLEEAIQSGHREFDFSTGDEAYKWLYSTHARILGPLGIPPLQLRLLVQAKSTARRVLSKHPQAMELGQKVARYIRNGKLLRR
jgi:hypothetical protein